MSDYPNPNIHRSDGISARGLLITLGVVLFIFVLLAALGSSTTDDGTPRATLPEGAATPAVESAGTVPITE